MIIEEDYHFTDMLNVKNIVATIESDLHIKKLYYLIIL